MSSKPWYAWFPSDYRAKTAHLNFVQDSAYRRLLDAYYDRRLPLPIESAALYRLASAQSKAERNAVDFVVKEFFTNGDGQLRHSRCDEQLAKEQALHEAWVEAGRRGGLSQAQARLNHPNPTLNPRPTPTPTPTPTSKTRSKTLSPIGDGAWEEFWKNCIRKTAKRDALRAWKRIKVEEIPAIMAALERDKASEQWQRGIIPHPATWLNQRRWEDETSTQVNGRDLGQCMWNQDGARSQVQPRCEKNGVEENRGLVYCEQHKHLHHEQTR